MMMRIEGFLRQGEIVGRCRWTGHHRLFWSFPLGPFFCRISGLSLESPGPVFRHKRSYWQLADFVRSERCGRTLDRDFDSDKNVRLQALVKVDRLSVCTSGYLRLRWDHETFVWRQPCTLGWSPSSGVIAGEYTEHPRERPTTDGRLPFGPDCQWCCCWCSVRERPDQDQRINLRQEERTSMMPFVNAHLLPPPPKPLTSPPCLSRLQSFLSRSARAPLTATDRQVSHGDGIFS